MAVSDATSPRGLQRFLLPPDFDPKRKIDATTWVEAIFEPVVLIASLVCFILGIVQFGTAIVPDWPTRFLPPLAAVVAIEAFGYARRVGDLAIRLKEWLVLLVPVLVLARLLPYLDDPTASLARDIPNWIQSPASLFSFGYVVDCLILLLVWWLALYCTECLNSLRVQPGEIPDESNSLARQVYEDNFRAVDHTEPLRALGRLYVGGAIILVFLGALAALGTDQIFSPGAIAQLIGFQRPSLQLIQVNVVLYFILGLLLLGEAHFVRQRTLWRLDSVEMPDEVRSQWIAGLVGLVLATALIAFILPTSYAMTLGEIVSDIFGFFLQIFYLIIGGFFFLIYLVFSLFGFKGGGGTASAPAMPTPMPHAAPPPSHGSPLDAVQSIVFWLIATGVVAYSLSVLWRKRGPMLANVRLLPILLFPWRLLRGLVSLLGRVGRDVSRAVAAAVPRFFHAAPTPARPQIRIRSLSRMTPREMVEYFYLSACEHIARVGYPRPAGQTPEEYESALRGRLPEVDVEFADLTAAFVEARYGPRTTTADNAGVVKVYWQTLKRKLRVARIARKGQA